jgi:hypothetical protein
VKPCIVCGKQFKPRAVTALTCSAECRKKHGNNKCSERYADPKKREADLKTKKRKYDDDPEILCQRSRDNRANYSRDVLGRFDAPGAPWERDFTNKDAAAKHTAREKARKQVIWDRNFSEVNGFDAPPPGPNRLYFMWAECKGQLAIKVGRTGNIAKRFYELNWPSLSFRYICSRPEDKLVRETNVKRAFVGDKIVYEFYRPTPDLRSLIDSISLNQPGPTPKSELTRWASAKENPRRADNAAKLLARMMHAVTPGGTTP